MHCHCGTNNRAPRWTFTDPCKSEVRPGAREESASPAWLADVNKYITVVYLKYKYYIVNDGSILWGTATVNTHKEKGKRSDAVAYI